MQRSRPDKLTLKDGADLMAHNALRLLPTDLVSEVGAFGARVRGGNAYPEADARARANMRMLRPDWSDVEIDAASARRWDNIGRVISEYSVLHRLNREGRITVHGREHLDAAKAHGRGVILLGLHLGNWEVCTPALASIGLLLSAFYDPQASISRNMISKQVRHRLGATLFLPNAEGVRQAMAHLKAGGGVGLFADEGVKGRVRGPFFGRPPVMDGNLRYAVRFARATGAAIMPGYIIRSNGCHFDGYCLPPIILPPEARPGARQGEDIMLLNAAVEPVVRDNLDQWFFLHDEIA